MSDEAKDKKFENEEAGDEDVEAHSKWGKLANEEPKEDDGEDDDVQAHSKYGKL